MDPIRKILAIIDPSGTTHTGLLKAALLAKALGAELELYACDTKATRQRRVGEALGGTRSPVELDECLEELAAPARAQGLRVTFEVDYGEPLHERLIDKVQRCSAEFVVKDTHHHSLMRRAFLTHTDWHLIRKCPVPLLLAKPRTWAARPRIVAALDPGHVNDKPATLDERILEVADYCARGLGGHVEVMHAFMPIALTSAPMTTEPIPLPLSAADVERELTAKTAQLAELGVHYGVTPERVHVHTGVPVTVLPNMAQELAADIVAMGAISRSAIERFLIGSTAESVLEDLPCDALIVKPVDFASALPLWSMRQAG